MNMNTGKYIGYGVGALFIIVALIIVSQSLPSVLGGDGLGQLVSDAKCPTDAQWTQANYGTTALPTVAGPGITPPASAGSAGPDTPVTVQVTYQGKSFDIGRLCTTTAGNAAMATPNAAAAATMWITIDKVSTAADGTQTLLSRSSIKETVKGSYIGLGTVLQILPLLVIVVFIGWVFAKRQGYV